MPRGRPPKRPSDASLDGASDEGAARTKLPRLVPDDFSSVVKHKLSSYSRTGQACDRCKVRKIRCDALPEGCSHCINQNLECFVTDRVSGRTERRGYLQELERQKTDLLGRVHHLERLLENNGIQVKPWQWPPAQRSSSFSSTLVDATTHAASGDTSPGGQWKPFGSLWVKDTSERSTPYRPGYSRSAALESHPVEGHLGVFADNAPLSSMKGTQLSVLGTTIDITHFDVPDMDNNPPGRESNGGLYNKSLRAFLRSTTNKNPPIEMELPPKTDALQYSEWYFLMIFPFIPILHKPSFMNLLTRIYDDPSFKPSISELVIVHMVFATIYFQYGVRNREEADRQMHLNDLSDKHYHWSLSKFYDIATDSSVASVQALVMIAHHARSFPKPGCATLIAGFTLSKAIELNLHRAAKIPGGGTTLENELRRRTWWSSLSLLVTLNGRLGRPMPITLEEFDTNFPLAIPDEYLTDEGVTDPTKIGQCSFLVGLMGYKITPLYMEMYSNLYSVRRDPRRYMDIVLGLEEQHQQWEESLPDELKVDKCAPGNQIFALYTQAFSHEFRLCLRHPSVCMTKDPKFCAENTKVCEETARKLLVYVQDLLKLKSLDTTWYQMSVYCAAMFSTLVAHWQRRFETTEAEMIVLKREMASWLAIITEIGLLVGTSSGDHLSNELDRIVTRTLALIEKDMGMRKPLPRHPLSSEKTQAVGSSVVKQGILSPAVQPRGQSDASAPNGDGPKPPEAVGTYYGSVPPPVHAHATTFPMAAYPNQPAVGAAANNGVGYESGDGAYLYAATAASVAAAQNGVGGSEAQGANPLVAFASQATEHMSNQAGGAGPGFMASNPWQDWTAAIADTQDTYSANALLTLGTAAHHRDVPVGAHGSGGEAAGGELEVGVGGAHAGQWPLLIFTGAGTVSGA